jgi:hypothetical protein
MTVTAKLLVSVVASGLVVLGCSGDASSPSAGNPQDGAAVSGTGGTGGTGGAGGTAGTGGAGATGAGGTGGSGASPAADAAASTGTLRDGSADAAPVVKQTDAGGGGGGGAVDWADCGQSSFKEGVSAADFCAEYMVACMFDPAGGGSGTERYKSLADCMASYSALSDGPRGGKACVAWQLCIASHPNNAATFCPRAPEASQMSGPCKASYL